MALGVTVTTPTSDDLTHAEGAYGSFLQLVVLCAHNSKLEAYEWKELGVALSDVKHPLTVDILSAGDFTEGAEARIRARIPSAMVRVHATAYNERKMVGRDAVNAFWEYIDGAGVAAAAGLGSA